MGSTPYSQNNNTPLCASLFAPIGIDIDSPFISDVSQALKHLKDNEIIPVKTFDVTSGNVLKNAIIALDLVDNQQAQNWTYSKIIRVQMIMNHILITVSDPEGYNPVLLVDGDTGNIYSLDLRILNFSQFNYTSNLFENFINFSNGNMFANEIFPSRQVPYTRSYTEEENDRIDTMRSGGTHSICARYKVYCVGYSPNNNTYKCFTGLLWNVQRIFQKDTLSFGPLEISRPEFLNNTDIVNYNKELENISKYFPNQLSNLGGYCPELSRFLITYQNKQQVKGSDNQVQWFNPYTPAPANINNIADNNITFSNI
jgi:hypothetical protein